VDVVGGLGRCAPATGCTGDTDCLPPLGRCDKTESADRCVQCLTNADCRAPFVCAATTKTCVECTITDQAACRADLAGARCVAGNSCGCAADADCGGATSGRVCDAATARCVPGCRQTGGNGCPASLSCTSAGDEIGNCQPMPGGDGGADASTDGGTPDTTGTDAPTDAFVGDGDASADAAGDGANGGDGAVADGRADGPDAAPLGGNIGGYVAGGGCQCDAGGAGDGPGSLLLVLAVALGVARRRRGARR
jgi:MYXO-CTERM domain-containing protein